MRFGGLVEARAALGETGPLSVLITVLPWPLAPSLFLLKKNTPVKKEHWDVYARLMNPSGKALDWLKEAAVQKFTFQKYGFQDVL